VCVFVCVCVCVCPTSWGGLQTRKKQVNTFAGTQEASITMVEFIPVANVVYNGFASYLFEDRAASLLFAAGSGTKGATYRAKANTLHKLPVVSTRGCLWHGGFQRPWD
jgi:hypothetical protein